MSNLIDETYFIDPIDLPDGSNNDLDTLIKVHEPEILRDLLGYELNKEVAEFSATSSQRIKDLVEGKEYTVSHNGRPQLIKWIGLQNLEKRSLIAYWCYYWWHRKHSTHTGNTGELTPMQKYAKTAEANQKAANSLRLLINLYGYCGQPEIEASAFNFLTKFESDYPEWIFKEVGRPGDGNMWGL